MAIFVPPDIAHHVISFVDIADPADIHTLLACTLISTSWRPSALLKLSKLFSHLTFASFSSCVTLSASNTGTLSKMSRGMEANKFLPILERDAQVAKCITHINIYASPNGRFPEAGSVVCPILEILKTSSPITTISIRFWSNESKVIPCVLNPAIIALFEIPSITTLRVFAKGITPSFFEELIRCRSVQKIMLGKNIDLEEIEGLVKVWLDGHRAREFDVTPNTGMF